MRVSCGGVHGMWGGASPSEIWCALLLLCSHESPVWLTKRDARGAIHPEGSLWTTATPWAFPKLQKSVVGHEVYVKQTSLSHRGLEGCDGHNPRGWESAGLPLLVGRSHGGLLVCLWRCILPEFGSCNALWSFVTLGISPCLILAHLGICLGQVCLYHERSINHGNLRVLPFLFLVATSNRCSRATGNGHECGNMIPMFNPTWPKKIITFWICIWFYHILSFFHRCIYKDVNIYIYIHRYINFRESKNDNFKKNKAK